MANTPHPDDRPDPNENMPAMRARVPEQVARGVFSTGVIVMTGATEFILDFVQNLGRPHQIVARIVVPHVVMPQFADALGKNIELYRQRFGPLPNPVIPGQMVIQLGANEPPKPTTPPLTEEQIVGGFLQPVAKPKPETTGSGPTGETVPGSEKSGVDATGTNGGVSGQPIPPRDETVQAQSDAASTPSPASPNTPQQPPVKKPTAQEVYDDLKLRDELLSGTYANAVMIGHGPHEFSFDFITNFYPQSAVSCRVFVAAGQVARLLESLKTASDQVRRQP